MCPSLCPTLPTQPSVSLSGLAINPCCISGLTEVCLSCPPPHPALSQGQFSSCQGGRVITEGGGYGFSPHPGDLHSQHIPNPSLGYWGQNGTPWVVVIGSVGAVRELLQVFAMLTASQSRQMQSCTSWVVGSMCTQPAGLPTGNLSSPSEPCVNYMHCMLQHACFNTHRMSPNANCMLQYMHCVPCHMHCL